MGTSKSLISPSHNVNKKLIQEIFLFKKVFCCIQGKQKLMPSNILPVHFLSSSGTYG